MKTPSRARSSSSHEDGGGGRSVSGARTRDCESSNGPGRFIEICDRGRAHSAAANKLYDGTPDVSRAASGKCDGGHAVSDRSAAAQIARCDLQRAAKRVPDELLLRNGATHVEHGPLRYFVVARFA